MSRGAQKEIRREVQSALDRVLAAGKCIVLGRTTRRQFERGETIDWLRVQGHRPGANGRNAVGRCQCARLVKIVVPCDRATGEVNRVALRKLNVARLCGLCDQEGGR